MHKTLKNSLAGLALAGVLLAPISPALAEVGGTITRSIVPISAPLPPNPWLEHWAQPALAYLLEAELASDRYALKTPDEEINLADAAELLVKLSGEPIAADRNIVDIAKELRLINDSDFMTQKIHGPEDTIPREVFSVALTRAMGLGMLAENAMWYLHIDFSDAEQVRFHNAVGLLEMKGIIQGHDGAFAPNRPTTYAEALKMVAAAHQYLETEAEAEAKIDEDRQAMTIEVDLDDDQEAIIIEAE